MENQTLQGQEGAAIASKPRGPKSKLKMWMSHRFIRREYEHTKRLLKKHKQIILNVLGVAASGGDGGYHRVTADMLERYLNGKKAVPDEKAIWNVINNLRILETLCGIELSVSLPKYTWRLKCFSNHTSLQMKGNILRNVEAKGKGRDTVKTTSKSPPIDTLEIEDITSRTNRRQSVFVRLISEVKKRYCPTVVKYKYDPLPRRVSPSGRRPRNEETLLMLHIPNGLNPSQLFKLYGSELTKIWTDFYGRRPKKGMIPTHKGRGKIRKAMTALEKEISIPGTPMGELPELLAKGSGLSESYIEKYLRPTVREERAKIIRRFISITLTEMTESQDISQLADDQIASALADKSGMSKQMRARFVKDFLPVIRKERRKHRRGGY